MMITFPVLLSFFLLCHTATACDQSKNTIVNVDVYYESLCPDSIRFINRQLVPNYDSLKNHLHVNLIPYGKARTTVDANGHYEFDCQHGPNECKGNKVQACVIEVLKHNQTQVVEFVGCLMSKFYDPTRNVQQCSEKLNIPAEVAEDISNCSTNGMGDVLLADYGKRTSELTPKLTFVPTIMINSKYVDQMKALNNFEQLICEYLNDDCDSSSIC